MSDFLVRGLVRRGAVAKAALVCGFSLSSCITPGEKKDMQNDIFNVQTRLLALERKLLDTSKDAKSTGESATKRIANTQAELDKIFRDLQQIRGDMDSLKVGVVTGQLPGQPIAENSLAQSLTKLDSRMEQMEQTQADLIDALKKAGLNIKTPPKKAEIKIQSPEQLKTALENKLYEQVIIEGNRLLNESSSEITKSELRLTLAESHYQLRHHRDAIEFFITILDSYHLKEKIPFVKMRLGDSFRELGELATARAYYEELVREYPESKEALLIHEKLAAVGALPAS